MISVAIIEDHPVFRRGLAEVLEEAPGLKLAHAAGSVEEFTARFQGTPDVVFLDLQLPGLEGGEAVVHLRDRGHAVVVLSASIDANSVMDAMGAGAKGYLTKEADPQEIVRAVSVVASGGTYVSATLASYLLRDQVKLTRREREILRLVGGGETDQDIAEQLFISVKTVHSHLDRIRAKTGRRRRAELTRLAVERGLLPSFRKKKG